MDTEQLREECTQLSRRLEGSPHWPELRAVYLEIATLVGRLQGAVAESARHSGDTPETRQAEGMLAQLKAIVRQVGLDIRLASEPALAIGLQTALDQAMEILDLLARLD